MDLLFSKSMTCFLMSAFSGLFVAWSLSDSRLRMGRAGQEQEQGQDVRPEKTKYDRQKNDRDRNDRL